MNDELLASFALGFNLRPYNMDSDDENGTTWGPGYLCCEGSDTRPGCDKWMCNTGWKNCAKKAGAAAMFCDLCGCTWCHECGPGMVRCVRWDGCHENRNGCDKTMCKDCAFVGDTPQSVRCNVCSDVYCATKTATQLRKHDEHAVQTDCMPEGSVKTSDTFTCDVCAGVKHVDTGDCAASFFEKCAANTYKGGYGKYGSHKVGRCRLTR